jgi:hypothetical protein
LAFTPFLDGELIFNGGLSVRNNSDNIYLSAIQSAEMQWYASDEMPEEYRTAARKLRYNGQNGLIKRL